ncbi:IS110 family transposase [Nocardia colli]|uniref:IS110 family transposase n=1 Tax=Nocardia colli TaxID=2545717 RepID=UPI0035E18485
MFWRPADTPPTSSDKPKCSLPQNDSPIGSGRSRAATASAATWPTGWSTTAKNVTDVPAKLSAQVRVFATGNGRKPDPVDAHSVALAALHAPDLRRVSADPELVALGLLADRRDGLGRARTETLNRIHRLLLELIPGGAKKFLYATQARDLIAELRPQDPVGRVQLRLVIELIEELETIDRKTKAADK